MHVMSVQCLFESLTFEVIMAWGFWPVMYGLVLGGGGGGGGGGEAFVEGHRKQPIRCRMT